MKRLFGLWRVVTGRDLRLLWFALRHEQRPGWLLPGLAGLALFAVEPLNVALPMLGVVDELVILPLVLHTMVGMLPVHVVDGYARAHPAAAARGFRFRNPRRSSR